MKKVTSLALVAGFLFLYTVTLRPGVLPADSGEFQLAASQLKIAHPPGFPLYILAGWLFTQLPGAAATNLNFLSALISSLTLGLLPFVVGELPKLKNINRDIAASLGGTAAAILFGTSTTLWSQATTTNIRSLTTFFATLAVFFLLRWINNSHSQSGAGQRPLAADHSALIIAVFSMSLGVTHHLSLAFVALVMLIVVLVTHWQVLTNIKLVGWLMAAVLFGLVPWLLLPLLEPSLRNGRDFLIYVTGLGFGGDFFFVESAADLLVRLQVMWSVLTFQFHWSAIAVAMVGLAWISWLRWRVGLLLGGSFVILTLIAATYRAPQTVEYMLPAYLPLVIGFGWLVALAAGGYGFGINVASEKVDVFRTLRPLRWVMLALILFAGWQTVQRWPQTWDSYRWLAQQHDTADYAFEILNGAPENSVIYAAWHWFTPLSYLQQVEGHRPDLDIVFVDPTFNNDWKTIIVNELVANRSVITTNFDPDTFQGLPPHLPLGEAFLWAADVETASTLSADFSPIDLTLGGRVLVRSVDQPARLAMSETSAVTFGWELGPARGAQEISLAGLKLFVHLVGSDGQIYAQQDVTVEAQAHGLSLTRFDLTPRPGVPLGQAQIMLGAYLPDGTQLLSTAGDVRTAVGTVEIVGTRWRPVTQNGRFERKQESGRRLVGTDYGTELGWQNDGSTKLYQHWQLDNGLYWTSVETIFDPTKTGAYVPLGDGITWLGFAESGSALPNGALEVSHQFASDRPILRDIGFAVRQVGYEADDFTWAWLNPDPDNDIPATGAIPTLKWIAGSQVTHPRTLTIPENAVVGQTTEGFLRLYDVFTRRPVPILDERVTADGRPWIRSGRQQIGQE